MWLVLALIAGVTVGVVEKDSIGKAFDFSVKTVKETTETVIQKTKDITK
jgi:hypothetical protein